MSCRARALARLIAVVVLPTPPFWLEIARMRGMKSQGSEVEAEGLRGVLETGGGRKGCPVKTCSLKLLEGS